MTRRRLALILAVLVVSLLVPASASAHQGHHRSVFVPPQARVHGHHQAKVLADWGTWVFGSPAESNPAISGTCQQDPHDRKIWFLPVSTAPGDLTATCRVPEGAILLISPGGYECSQAEGNGSTRTELRACAKAGFAGITAASVTVGGHTYDHLGRYVKVSPVYQLPGPNLFGPDAGPSVTKGYFLFIKPLRPGHHVVESSIAFSDGFAGGITYDIEVVPKHRH